PLRLAAEGPEAVLHVADTGIGIDPDVAGHVFDVFTQADRSLERSRGGLGLGLAVVKGLVERHGGRVEARSDGPGRGSTFTVRLPLEEEPAALAGGDAPGPAGGGPRPRPVGRGNPAGPEGPVEVPRAIGPRARRG